MTTQEGDNAAAVAIEGNFDDCQRAVKEIFGDKSLIEHMKKNGAAFGSANSINIGRLLPQIAYYFSAYADMCEFGEIKRGDMVNFAVPTGNFGNILAGYYAKRMGLPIGKLICASNDNNILTDFFNTGTYDTKREFKRTISPSMDILVSSNLERLIFELAGRDDMRTAALTEELGRTGMYRVSEEERKSAANDFYAWYADEDTARRTIERFFDEYDYLLDPHTATAVSVYEKYRRITFDDAPAVIVATAHPYKFASDVYEAVMRVPETDGFRAAAELEEISALPVPEQINDLKGKKILHTKTVKKEQIKDMLMEFLNKKR
jgi:threonine synthase